MRRNSRQLSCWPEVNPRTRELEIRMAIGARTHDVTGSDDQARHDTTCRYRQTALRSNTLRGTRARCRRWLTECPSCVILDFGKEVDRQAGGSKGRRRYDLFERPRRGAMLKEEV